MPAFIPPSPITTAQQARGLRIYSVGLLLMAASMAAVAFAQIRMAVDPPSSVVAVAVAVAVIALMGSICVQAVGLGHCTSGGERDSLVWALIGLVAVPFTFVSWPISLGLALRFIEGFVPPQNQMTGLPVLRRIAFATVLVPLSILAGATVASYGSIGGWLLAYAYLVGLLAFIAAVPMWLAASHVPPTP